MALLGIKYDIFSHTSDHFDLLLKYCEQMIKEKKAYADNTDGETMKKERELRQDSVNRNNCECLLQPTSRMDVMALTSCVSECVCYHSPGRTDRHTDLKFGMSVKVKGQGHQVKKR